MPLQERLFEPSHLLDPNFHPDSIPSAASERRTVGGEQASGAKSLKARAEGSCLDNWVHNYPYTYTNRDTSLYAKPESEIEVCMEGSAVRVKIKKDLPHRQMKLDEMLYCAPGYEDNRERAIELLRKLKKDKRSRRGKITRCTPQSCRRLRDRVSELKRTENPVFVGLTFPDQFPSTKEAHRHLYNFMRRALRTFQGSGIFWKMEIKPRLSGVNKGKKAPHFHLFVYGVDFKTFKKWSKRAWWEVVGSGDYWHRRKGCNVTEVYDLRGIRIYLRKYFTKPFEEVDPDGIGRTWGSVGKLPWGEVRKVTAETKVVYAILRNLRSKEIALRKQLAREKPGYKYRPPSRGKRSFDTEIPERFLELIELHQLNQVPF